MTSVAGDEAASYNAVRLDSYANVNQGPLTYADTETGEVRWKDSVGEVRTKTLGVHAIRLVLASR